MPEDLPERPRATHLDDVPGTVLALSKLLSATAVTRDREGGHAAQERRLLRDSGLLTLTLPQSIGGLGGDWPLFYQSVRRLAQADSALAHVFAFHHLQLATIQLYGTPEQTHTLLEDTVSQRLFWGNALNPLDHRAIASEIPEGWMIDGVKSYASGSVGADRLIFSAWHGPSASALVGWCDPRDPAIQVNEDWDSFGQKQTDSGTVSFQQWRLPRSQVLCPPAAKPASPRTTLRTSISQLIMANLYTGIAQGALEECRHWLADATVAGPDLRPQRVADDPRIQLRFGELALPLRPAQVLSDLAAQRLQLAWEEGHGLTATRRGELALAISEAKVFAHRAAMGISNGLFELTGARSTRARFGLDRFWRNARVHTLHDPVDLKILDLGRHALTGGLPEPTPYS